MLDQNKLNARNTEVRRKALLIDEDQDRYRRKERTTLLQNAGFKVFPVLRLDHARNRCKPGAFDLIVAGAGENSNLVLEFCDEIKRSNPNQQLFLVANSNSGIASRDYIVADWDELRKRIGGESRIEEKPEQSQTAA